MNTPLTKQDLNPIHTEIQSLIKSVTRIENALLGDEKMEIEGIASKVNSHGKYIDKAKTRHAWITGISAGIGMVFHQFWEWLKS